MRLDHFHKEARRQAERFEKDPKLYRRRLFWFAVMGFLYPAMVALISLAVSLLAAWGGYLLFDAGDVVVILWGVAVVGLIVTGMIIRAMLLPFPKPDGHPLAIEDAPKLFERVEEVRQKLDAPKIHSIYLTNEFNMAVTRRPLFGFFGPAQNILIVGLWMMEALSLEEIRSVIAHELGHLSRQHNRATFWFFKLWQLWDNLADPGDKSQGKTNQSFLFKGFVNWYGPRFQARSMVLRKAHELEADRFGMAIADSGTVLREHIKIAMGAAAMEKVFWPDYFRGAYDTPLPPKDPFERVVNFLKSLDTVDLLPAIRGELVQPSMPYDTHPSTRQRLAYLKFQIPDAQRVLAILSQDKTSPRASSLLSDKTLEHYRDYYNRLLKAAHIFHWRQKHSEAEEARKKYDSLKGKTDLTETEKWELACFQYKYMDKERNCDAIHGFLNSYPQHPAANFILGQRLLNENDEKGIAHIEKAMSGDSGLISDGLEVLSLFSEQRTDVANLAAVMERWDLHIKNVKAANKDRSRIKAQDQLETADISQQDREKIQKILVQYKTVKEAFLVRKKVQLFTDKPCYILAVFFIRKNLIQFDPAQEQILVNCLYSDLPKIEGLHVCSMNTLSKSAIQKIRNVENSKLWPA